MGAGVGLADAATGGRLQSGLGTVTGFFTGQGAKEAAREQQARIEDVLEEAKKTQTSKEQTRDLTSTSQTTFAPATAQEKALQEASIKQFQQAQNLAAQQEAAISGRQPLQTQARETLGGIQTGEAFALSPEEQARIDALTQASTARGDERINRLLNERLGQLQAQAAERGVRGQAFSQLQTGALETAAQEATAQQLAAEERAAQLGIQLPGQRVGIQAQTAGGLAEFSDQARQQAIENRLRLQDPTALSQLREERLRGGKTTQTQTGTLKDTQTGVGVGELLQAKAGATGVKAAEQAGIGTGISTGLDILGTGAQIAKTAGGGGG